MGMVNITKKEVIYRKAIVSGKIYLKNETIKCLKEKNVKKGEPLQVAEVAGINACKQTQFLIPYCHQIPLDNVDFKFVIDNNSIEVTCKVEARSKTGVEMEALIGTLIALGTLLDMVKYLEKDKKGQYPETRISDIRILKKEKYGSC